MPPAAGPERKLTGSLRTRLSPQSFNFESIALQTRELSPHFRPIRLAGLMPKEDVEWVLPS